MIFKIFDIYNIIKCILTSIYLSYGPSRFLILVSFEYLPRNNFIYRSAKMSYKTTSLPLRFTIFEGVAITLHAAILFSIFVFIFSLFNCLTFYITNIRFFFLNNQNFFLFFFNSGAINTPHIFYRAKTTKSVLGT